MDADREPLGPLSTEHLVEWMRAGLVVTEALVCEVGTDEWRSISDVPQFDDALPERRRRFDPSSERCVVDMESLPPDSASSPRVTEPFDPSSEVTAVAVPRPSCRA